MKPTSSSCEEPGRCAPMIGPRPKYYGKGYGRTPPIPVRSRHESAHGRRSIRRNACFYLPSRKRHGRLRFDRPLEEERLQDHHRGKALVACRPSACGEAQIFPRSRVNVHCESKRSYATGFLTLVISRAYWSSQVGDFTGSVVRVFVRPEHRAKVVLGLQETDQGRFTLS